MVNHKQLRKQLKKLRRKRIRTEKAKERDEKLLEEKRKRASSPTYLVWKAEQEALELFKQQEEQRLYEEQHKKWLQEEAIAKKRWEEQQKRLECIKAEKAKQEIKIREEWERQQERILEDARRAVEALEMKKREEAELLESIERYMSGDVEELPVDAKKCRETRPGEQICPFFSKVAACRFKDQCSRNHVHPGVSRTLLFPGFFSHFTLEKHQHNEYDTDISLEYESNDTYQAFLEFYDDVLPELKTYGNVLQFKVCCNLEPHLKGNVYVQYETERDTIRAYRSLHGRYYGGKKIYAEFCNVPSWTRAICGLYRRNKCPKGDVCNFMHVFRDPTKEFLKANNDSYLSVRERVSERTDATWEWSPSPEHGSMSSSIRSIRSSYYNSRSRRSRESSQDSGRTYSNRSRRHHHRRSDSISSYRSNSREDSSVRDETTRKLKSRYRPHRRSRSHSSDKSDKIRKRHKTDARIHKMKESKSKSYSRDSSQKSDSLNDSGKSKNIQDAYKHKKENKNDTHKVKSVSGSESRKKRRSRHEDSSGTGRSRNIDTLCSSGDENNDSQDHDPLEDKIQGSGVADDVGFQ